MKFLKGILIGVVAALIVWGLTYGLVKACADLSNTIAIGLNNMYQVGQ